MVGFIVGFVLGFGLHYALFCTRSGQDVCKKCWEWCGKKRSK